MNRSSLTKAEVAYLTSERRLGRIATADGNGLPHVTPVGMWRYVPEEHIVEVTGRDFARTRKFRDVEENPQAALVVDDIASSEPWRPRGILVRGRAEAVRTADGNGVIRILPDHVTSWGL